MDRQVRQADRQHEPFRHVADRHCRNHREEGACERPERKQEARDECDGTGAQEARETDERTRELLDRTLIVNQRHLLHALREYEAFYNKHRPHQGIANARPLAPLPEPITDPHRIAHLNIHRRDRLGGILHEYDHAA